MKRLFLKLSQFLPDTTFTKIIFLLKQRMLLRLHNPQTLNEKVTYIKLFSENPLRKLIVDRLKVREYVKSRCPGCELIPILWTGTNFTKDVYDKLPNRFVIKGNHGSQMILFVDKSKDTLEFVLTKISGWLTLDYYLKGRELVYKNLDRYFIVEEMLEFEHGIPPDFKFHCFDGKVELVQLDLSRFTGHRRNLYDRNFNKLEERLRHKNGKDMEKPEIFDKAIMIAQSLSSDFSYIRVDLYLIGAKVYFGELTNFPGNGLERFIPRKFDYYLGSKLQILY